MVAVWGAVEVTHAVGIAHAVVCAVGVEGAGVFGVGVASVVVVGFVVVVKEPVMSIGAGAVKRTRRLEGRTR